MFDTLQAFDYTKVNIRKDSINNISLINVRAGKVNTPEDRTIESSTSKVSVCEIRAIKNSAAKYYVSAICGV
jgi:hypothetical protein